MKKEILMFISGFAIGCLSTYLIVNKKMSDKYEQIANEEIQSVMDSFSDEENLKRKKEIEKRKHEEDFLYDKNIDKLTTNYSKNNFEKYYDFEGRDEEEMAEMEHPQDDLKDQIYLIDLDTFTHEDNSFEKMTLEYYPESDILRCCEDNEILEIDETIGLENLNNFGGSFEDFRDTMFIRNERLGIDYEVVRCEGQYFEEG